MYALGAEVGTSGWVTHVPVASAAAASTGLRVKYSKPPHTIYNKATLRHFRIVGFKHGHHFSCDIDPCLKHHAFSGTPKLALMEQL